MCGIIPSSTYIMKVQVTSLIPQPVSHTYLLYDNRRHKYCFRTDNVKCACCFILQLYKPQHKILNNKLNKLLCYIIS